MLDIIAQVLSMLRGAWRYRWVAVVIIERSLGIIQTNLRTPDAFFSKYSDSFEWLPPRAGSVAFPRWCGPGSVESFSNSAVEKAGVMIVPGSIFNFPGDHFRVGLGRTSFMPALEALEPVIHGINHA